MTSSPSLPPLSLEQKIRVYTLAEEIISANGWLITTEAIVTTPCYLGEERRKELVDAISNQKGTFTAVMYLNAPRSSFTESSYKRILSAVKKYAKKDKRILIIGHLYDEKHGLWAIRADLMDAITDSIAYEKIGNPKLIGLDADTYKLDQYYITSMSKKLNTTSGRLSSDLRRYDQKQAKGDERAFLVERVFVFAMLEWKEKSDDTYFAGASFGVKLSDYLKAGGFNRSLVAGEDLQLGYDLKSAWLKGHHFSKKVYVDHRRGQHTVNQRKSDQYGKKCFIQQDDRKTLPLFTTQEANERYKQLTAISRKLLYGKLISIEEQKLFETLFNELHFFWSIREGKSDHERWPFIQWRNTSTKSLYKVFPSFNVNTWETKIELKKNKST